jgi:membrane-associated phospholipid phosphatase
VMAALITVGLWISEQAAWGLWALVLVALWFSGDEGQSRKESRQRALIMALGMVTAFAVTHLLSRWINHPPDSSIFPDDFAAVAGVVASVLFSYDRRIGLIAGATSLLVGAARVAAGVQYPAGIVAGLCLGIIVAAFWLLMRQRLSWLIKPPVLMFDWLPMLAYPVGLLFLVDVCQHLRWISGLTAALVGG